MLVYGLQINVSPDSSDPYLLETVEQKDHK